MANEDIFNNLNSTEKELKLVKEYVYDKCNFLLENLKLNLESSEYLACSFYLNWQKIEYRVSKITPKKVGQFVAIWKRNMFWITEPFDFNDDLDYLVITSKDGDNFGQFIFPKEVLVEKWIITKNWKLWKRWIRVYPSWDIPTNKQAQKTKSWQEKYFLIIKSDNSTDLELAKNFFKKIN